MYPQISQAQGLSSSLFKATLLLSSTLFLTACVAPKNISSQGNTQTSEPVKTGPEYVEGLGYKFEWESHNSAVFTSPAEVKIKALKICTDKGFTTTYMSSISFDEQTATGYFNCRGSGGN